GYYWRGEINSKYESGSTIKGYAAPYFEKYIELTSADATKAAFKPRLVKAYLYLAYYKSSIKENDKSKEYLAKVLELEPENEVAKALKTQLK
ncbi:MAG: hypothetical protein H7321_09040, partial [Bacteroidia bacterium]|nr:hypothetical protein [Bacteroidia bacterium]